MAALIAGMPDHTTAAEPEIVVEKPKAPVEPKPVEPEADPVAAKGLAAVAKAEKRSRDAVAEERAAVARDRAELARERAEMTSKVASFEDLQKAFRKDRLGTLAKLGATEDDLESIGQEAYYASPAGKAAAAKSPAGKAAADRAARDREVLGSQSAQEKRVADLEAKIEAMGKAAETEKSTNRLLDEVVKAVPPEPTLIAIALRKNPEAARAKLHAIGAYLEKQNGESPEHSEVIAAYEKIRRAELEADDVDVDALLKPKTAAPVVVEKKKIAATIDPSVGSPARPLDTSKQTEEQRRAQIVKDMPWEPHS